MFQPYYITCRSQMGHILPSLWFCIGCAFYLRIFFFIFFPENLKSFLFWKDFRVTEKLQRWYRGYPCTFIQFFSPDLTISHSVVHLSKLRNQRFYLEFLFSFRLPANKYYHIFCETGVFCSLFQLPLVDFHST